MFARSERVNVALRMVLMALIGKTRNFERTIYIQLFHHTTLTTRCEVNFRITPPHPTVLLVRIKRVPLIVLPANYLNELRNEARYAALENSRVPAYHVLVVYFRLIILVYHYNIYIYVYINGNESNELSNRLLREPCEI